MKIHVYYYFFTICWTKIIGANCKIVETLITSCRPAQLPVLKMPRLVLAALIGALVYCCLPC